MIDLTFSKLYKKNFNKSSQYFQNIGWVNTNNSVGFNFQKVYIISKLLENNEKFRKKFNENNEKNYFYSNKVSICYIYTCFLKI